MNITGIKKRFSSTTQLEFEDNSSCCHIDENSLNKIVGYAYERDSFGEEKYFMCQSCFDEYLKSDNEELVICHDCGKEVQKQNTISWKWYDYYEPEGLEPLIICTECQNKEKHIKRVADDKAAADYENDY